MLLSVVIPVYRGEKSIRHVVEELIKHLQPKVTFEIILVNDCSPDNSWQVLQEIHQLYDRWVTIVNLAKNFGEHNAVMAGYHYCKGDYIVNIDDDFQNPPAEILKLLDKIQLGFDVVYSYYAEKKHSLIRNCGSWLNDKVANIMLKKPKGLYLSSFRIITAQLKNQILQYQGPYPYIDGIILQNTAQISTVLVEHLDRQEGTSSYTWIKLLRLWSHVFFNFSLVPLRFATFLGLTFSSVSLIAAVVFMLEKFFNPALEIGWASIIVSNTMFSGISLFVVGIIGEYLGRLYLSQNKTPQFNARQVIQKK